MAQVGRGWGISSPSTKRAISCRPEPTHALLITCSGFLWLVFAIKVTKQQAILLQGRPGCALDFLSLNSRLAQILNGCLNTKSPNPVESELALPMRTPVQSVRVSQGMYRGSYYIGWMKFLAPSSPNVHLNICKSGDSMTNFFWEFLLLFTT